MSVYVGFKLSKAIDHHAYTSEYYCGGCGWPVSDHYSYCPECGGAFRKEDATERTCEGCVIPSMDYGHAPSPCIFCVRNHKYWSDLYTPADVVE